MLMDRPERLPGITQQIDIHIPGEMVKLFITVNYEEGRAVEVFLNTKNPELNEHMAVLTLLISRMLRGGFSLDLIAHDLVSIESAFTGHMTKDGFCPSLAARIGRLLHEMNVQPELVF